MPSDEEPDRAISSDYRPSDLTEFVNIFGQEYNNSDLHDRVLVLDVVKDASSLPGAEVKQTTNVEESSGNISKQREDHSPLYETANLVDRKRSMRVDDGNSAATPKLKKQRSELGLKITESETTAIDADFGEIRTNPDNSETDSPEMSENHPTLPAQTETAITASEVLRQHRIFVHATWLAVHSTYFRSLFYSGLKESSEKEVHLKIPECEEKCHMQLLKAIYRPDVLNENSVDELLLLLELADKYAVKFVFRKTKYVLMATELSVEICEKILYVILVKQSMVNVDDLVSTVQSFLAQTFSPLDKTWQTESFVNLTETSLRLLFGSDNIATQSENTVFHSLMHWIERNHYAFDSPTSNTKSPLLSVVRFGLLTIDYLYNVVQYHPIGTKMAGFSDLFLKGVSYHALPKQMRERLKEKPVMRKKVEKMVQYTWILEKEKLEVLNDGTVIVSEHFWWCGYEMNLTMDDCEIIGSWSSRDVSIKLHSVDLRSESYFTVSWVCKAKNISSSYEVRHTFTKEQSKSTTRVSLKSGGSYHTFACPASLAIEVTIY